MAASAKDLQLRELKDTVSQLKMMISEQTELIRFLREVIDTKSEMEQALREQNRLLQEQIDHLKKKLFAPSSEKRSAGIPGQLHLFDEAETEQDLSKTDAGQETAVSAHTRKKKASSKETFKGLKVNKIVIPLSPEEQICPVCGTQMTLIGEEYVRRELVFIPAKCEINEYYTQSYGCPSCKEGYGNTEKPVIIKSKVPSALVGKGPASPSSAAWTMYQKYANGMPLYRQEKDWAQYGAAISRTTLANWIINCSQHYFQPLYDYFHRELLKRRFAMADETRVQVLDEPDRKAETQSFMWLFRSGEDGQPTIILYDYSQPAVQGVQYCDRLFRIEDDINKRYPGNYEKRKQLRLEKEKPVLEAFWSWLDSLHPVRNSRMYKAVNYVQNRRETAETYLEDGRCSFTNNASENAIRPFTVGRKNWLFSQSVEGAGASAVVYTMVEMAKAHKLNIYEYLKYVLEQRPDNTWTDEQLSELAPWSEQLQSIKKSHID